MTDPIADFLTRIRNAQMARHSEVTMPFSKVKLNIAKVMKKNELLLDVKKDETQQFPQLVLSLPAKKLELTRVSKPGQRIYIKSDLIRKVKNGFGIAVISTSQGIITGYEARARKIGGEYLCDIS